MPVEPPRSKWINNFSTVKYSCATFQIILAFVRIIVSKQNLIPASSVGIVESGVAYCVAFWEPTAGIATQTLQSDLKGARKPYGLTILANKPFGIRGMEEVIKA